MDRLMELLEQAVPGGAAALAAAAQAEGVTDVATARFVQEDEWVGWGVPRIRARALMAALNEAEAAPSWSAQLPDVPDDTSLLAALVVGGVAKVEATDVVAALRVAFAERLGLFGVEERLLRAMEDRALSQDAACPTVFYDLQRVIARRAQAEVLTALALPGAFATDGRKRELVARVGRIWAPAAALQQQIEAWRTLWADRSAHGAALVTAKAAAGLPVDAPDAGAVLDAARTLIDAINRAFAGTGIPVARALAADVVQLRGLLERPELPAAMGLTTREEVLRALGVAVPAELARTEQSAVRWVSAAMGLPQTPADELPVKLVAMVELGATLPWPWLAAGTAVPRRS